MRFWSILLVTALTVVGQFSRAGIPAPLPSCTSSVSNKKVPRIVQSKFECSTEDGLVVLQEGLDSHGRTQQRLLIDGVYVPTDRRGAAKVAFLESENLGSGNFRGTLNVSMRCLSPDLSPMMRKETRLLANCQVR